MEKYSATYTNTNANFTFQNIEGCNVENKYFGVFCVLKNIIQRGTPTHPSDFLQNRVGTIMLGDNNPLLLISKDSPVWLNLIKGNDETNDNPALVFFNELIPKYFGDYTFVRQLILPEAKIDDIVSKNTNEFYDQQVDFYIPQARLVVEIDGSQHANQIQNGKDKERDKYFYKHNITTIRIPVSSIKSKDENLYSKMEEVINIIKSSKTIEKYKITFENRLQSENEILKIKFETIMRFQILIISLLQKNIIGVDEKEWKLHLVDADANQILLCKIAIEDLFIWLEHICKLRKIDFEKPSIAITNYNKKSKPNSIIIDIDILLFSTTKSDLNKSNLEVIVDSKFLYKLVFSFFISSNKVLTRLMKFSFTSRLFVQ